MTGILKHLVDWKYWSDEDVVRVLDLAQRVKHHRWEYQGLMQGNTLVMIFQKTSTRTRCSGEIGIGQLGGRALYLDWRSTNFGLANLGAHRTRNLVAHGAGPT